MEKIGNIYVESIEDRSGQIMRVALEQALGCESTTIEEKKYSLSVQLKKTKNSMAIDSQGLVGRYSIVTQATYALSNKERKVLLARTLQSSSSYSVLKDSPYSVSSAEQDAEEKNLGMLASSISLELSLYFSKNKQE